MKIGIGIGIEYQRGGGFSPASLFAGGEQGAWYDPSDLTTLFQDDAGATPVTAAGQTVGRILDKSGRGNHATQATLGSRPTYRTSGGRHWLEFDGTDDFIVSGTITPGTDKAQVFTGVQTSSGADQCIVETGNPGGASQGLFSLFCGNAARSRYESKGSAAAVAETGTGVHPGLFVITTISDISADLTRVRNNGGSYFDSAGDQGTGNFLAYPMYIGRRDGTTFPLGGNLYGLIARFGANLTAERIAATEAFMAAKSGVTL